MVYPCYWLYYCAECRYFAHVHCALSAGESGKNKNRNDDEGDIEVSGLVHFPVSESEPYLLYRLIQQYAKKFSISTDEKSGKADIISQCRNGHSLILFDAFTYKDAVERNNNDNMRCDGCVQPLISSPGPFYGCLDCNFFLHRVCAAELPREIQHASHPRLENKNWYQSLVRRLMTKYISKMTTPETSKTKTGSFGLNYPTLTKENYTVWAMKMKVIMQAHGVWEAVESSDPKREIDVRTDKVALAMIYQGIPEEWLLSLASKESAKEAWVAIKTLCQGAERVKTARIQSLKSEFESLTMKESEQIDDFCMKLNGLVTNIRALGEKVSEAYVVKKLLRAVPAKFLQITSTLEQFGDLENMIVEEAAGSLKAHEERVKCKTESSGGQLLLSEEEWSKRENDENKLLLTREEWQRRTNKSDLDACGSQRRRGGRDKSRIQCYNCGIFGHYAAECLKPKKNKERRQEVNMALVEDEETTLLLTNCDKKEENMTLLNEKQVIPALKTEDTKGQAESNLWYLDNGASNHMTGCKSKFSELNEGISGLVRFGDGSTVKIEGKGSITFKCKNGEERVLTEVYYIPNLRSNIISLGQMSESGNEVTLKGKYLWVFDKKKKLLMKVKRSQNRLYKLLIETTKPSCLMLKSNEIARLWHIRLGHVNYKAMELMYKGHMVKGLPRITQVDGICDGCLLAKQTRKRFPSQSNYSATQVLDLVHGDLCGPIVPDTASGNKYFFLLVDDYSRYMWAYLLKSKDEALSAFKSFCALVENKPGKKVKVFRTDRGGEFCSREFKSYYEEKGIERHYTAPYTPQQNGIVERRNRTVVEMARSYLKEMKLPPMLWGEAIRHTVYILNKLPTRALSGETPYEVPSCQTSKLDDRSVKVINLGKEPGTKAYRLYDPEKKRICVSRDVMFEEDKLWVWNNQGNVTDRNEWFMVPKMTGEDDTNSQGANNKREDDVNDSEGEEHIEYYQSPTQTYTSSAAQVDSDNYDDSQPPRRFRALADIYNNTEPIELDEELLLMGVDEPTCYKQATKSSEWRQAMSKEMDSIEKNNTWHLTELPKGHKAIGLKWIYKIKRDAGGKIVKHKARLVAKGYIQEQGIDFDEIFAPVTRIETVRLLLALAARNGWKVHPLDVKTTFLNGEILEEVYVSQPEGYERKGKEHLVYKLAKALYGLRQAPRAWYAKLNKCLEGLGFIRCPYEHAVYTRRTGEDSVIVGVYVDDLLITGSSTTVIETFKKQMSEIFEMTNLGELSYYVGIEVHQGDDFIELKQAGYAKKVLEKAGMANCNASKYLMDTNLQINKDGGGELLNATDYKSLVGCLRYLVHTRPDISYAVGIVSRYMEHPTVLYLEAVKRILRYIRGTIHFGLVYSKGSGNHLLSGFSDSDLAGQVDDRKSTGGMVFLSQRKHDHLGISETNVRVTLLM
ncbi:hypothetical protein AgCh_000227 [Apium graveolens]